MTQEHIEFLRLEFKLLAEGKILPDKGGREDRLKALTDMFAPKEEKPAN